ncbi:acyltransferase domain-containing protein [Variovorax sp. S2]|uniref:ACP S-malonyltransferase n=1 Tax=Variovorax sp. S12S4 TaxID=3029170 RepID=UPI00215CB114|nr:acyltransferase domain-containing protein [Variovorax sp. S12S4]MCR8960675.1 acyltransferase domain-containing protein [Variovorax sp. S12S4]
MSYALLFSGQGTQHPAMLPWLADDAIVRDMCAQLAIDDWRGALADPEWAGRNSNAQLLLTSLALAAWGQLAPRVPPPAAVAGYSVGELAAFSAAGVIDPGVATALAPQRAEAMDRCAAHAPGGLLAVGGLPEQRLEQLRIEAGLELAIRNGNASVVLGGPVAALDKAEQMAMAAGAHCTRLRVNVASHTSWMREAAKSFFQALAQVPFRAPRVVLFSNTGSACAMRTLPARHWRPRSLRRFAGTNAWKTSWRGRCAACWRSGRARRWRACGTSAIPPFRHAPATTSAAPRPLQPG